MTGFYEVVFVAVRAVSLALVVLIVVGTTAMIREGSLPGPGFRRRRSAHR
ncbi:MAG: hypothetical protein JWM27_573 [Gemmatimonadetes bacterium]|nr:hypothetical protein [Gemmatimonadota bacterium]